MSATYTPFASPSEVYAALGRPATSYQRDVARGLAPPLVVLGTRRRALPRTELDLLIRARQAGLSNDEVKVLVAEAVADRAKVAAIIRSGAADAL
jgi:hypothetical protein